jgi:RimJ/RimL family protein N-acetyltransferase
VSRIYRHTTVKHHPRQDIIESDTLVGGVSLVPVDPPKYGLGYWLATDACGRGLATLAVQAVTGYARDVLGATDVFAGVTHGNHASVGVLERAGFHRVAEFESCDCYHRPTV